MSFAKMLTLNSPCRSCQRIWSQFFLNCFTYVKHDVTNYYGKYVSRTTRIPYQWQILWGITLKFTWIVRCYKLNFPIEWVKIALSLNQPSYFTGSMTNILGYFVTLFHHAHIFSDVLFHSKLWSILFNFFLFTLIKYFSDSSDSWAICQSKAAW